MSDGDDKKPLSPGRQLLLDRHKAAHRQVGRKYNPENLLRILRYLANMPVISEACKHVGIHRTSLQYYLAKSASGHPGFDIQTGDFDENDQPITEKFHVLYDLALKTGVEKVEAGVFKRAYGYEEVLTHKGRVIYQQDPKKLKDGKTGAEAYLLDDFGRPIPETVLKQDPELMQFILKSHKPETYGSKQQIDVMHSGGVLVVGMRAKNSEELEKAATDLANAPVDVEFEEVHE